MGPRNVATDRTSLRYIAGANKSNGHTEYLSFVGQKGRQGVETPVMVSRSLSPANRRPLGDAVEVFKGDTKVVPLGLRDERFTDAGVCVFWEASLATGQLFEPALSALTTNGLQLLAPFCVPASLCFKLSAGEGLAVGVDSEIDYAKVDAQPSVGVVVIRWRGYRSRQVCAS